MGDLKNYGKSNRDKLLNLAKQTKGTDYNMILLRFVQERFLYRLSLSAYRKNFFLKGVHCCLLTTGLRPVRRVIWTF